MPTYETSRVMTPRLQRCLESAEAFAESVGHNYIGTEHVVLGILGDEEAVPSEIAERMGGVGGMLLYQLCHYVQTGRLSESIPRLVPETAAPSAVAGDSPAASD